MRSWRPYLWKELRESRWLALGALGVFLGISFLPQIIDAARSRGNWYNGNALGMLILCGPLLAIVAGVYAMGREQGAMEPFWRSRPINLNRWLVSKYFVGLALVWLICWVPLLIEVLGRSFERPHRPVSENISMSLVYSFILLLIYSASFVLGQCIRGPLHAAILAVGVMALIFVIPLVVAPLNWLSVEMMRRADLGALNTRAYVAFATPMIVLSLALLGLSGVLLKRNIQVDVDRRALGWSVAAILLVLAAGVAFPMGTNLPAQQVISLPALREGVVRDIATNGNNVLILLSGGPAWRGAKLGLIQVHLDEGTPVMDEPIWFVDPGQEQNLYYNPLNLMWPTEDPSIAYVVVGRSTWGDGTLENPAAFLYTVALDGKQVNPVVQRTELNPLLATQRRLHGACLYQQRLYLYSDEPRKEKLLTLSLADPRTPSLVHTEHLLRQIGWAFQTNSEQYRVWPAPISGLDDSTRLEITHELTAYPWVPAGKGRVLASDFHSGGLLPQLVLYETSPTQDDAVLLNPIARRRSAALQGLFGPSYGKLSYSDPLAYRLEGTGVTVYRIGASNRIERLGHYAAEGGFSAMASLPGYRVVLAGESLHVLDLSQKLSTPSVR